MLRQELRVQFSRCSSRETPLSLRPFFPGSGPPPSRRHRATAPSAQRRTASRSCCGHKPCLLLARRDVPARTPKPFGAEALKPTMQYRLQTPSEKQCSLFPTEHPEEAK